MQKLVRAVIVNLEFINIRLTENIVDEQYNLTTRVFLFYFIFISFWNEIKILETFWNVEMGKKFFSVCYHKHISSVVTV